MASFRLRFVSGLRSLIVAALLAGGLCMVDVDRAFADGCSAVDFAAGTRWSFCWSLRASEGLVLSNADYTARGGTARRVLARGSVAQLHVPYHTGSPRFRDVTVYGLGGTNALDLTAAECAPGTLVEPKVCLDRHAHGYAWKFQGLSRRAESATLWLSSQVGNYNYITQWTLGDDGSIEPTMGLTGRLQLYGNTSGYTRHGTRVNEESASTPRIGLNHLHDVFWRLDLDLAGDTNDAVNRITTARHTSASPDSSCQPAGLCHANTYTRIQNEVADRWAPYTTWQQIDRSTLNADGRAIGYEIIPKDNLQWSGPSTEAWSSAELYVTRYNGCEMFATDNNNPSINPGCASAPPDVRAMVQSSTAVDGADVVLWYVAHFQHVVRDEDEPNMPIHFFGLELSPRSWSHQSTID